MSCFLCVGEQCYRPVRLCVRVCERGVRIVGFFLSPPVALLVLLFAAKHGDVGHVVIKVSSESTVAPAPLSLKCSQEVSAALAWDQRLPSVSGL